MQIYAQDLQGKIISADSALRQTDYFCLECNGIVRLRGGSYRRRHFYHLASSSACREGGKSLAHLHLQSSLHKLLGCSLEHHFPSIGRIADAYWGQQGLIFEIQCSPITAEEVRARCNDYQSLGLTVVWIFHDRRYNRTYLSAAEAALQHSPHFFSNGHLFYDQVALIRGGRKVRRSPRFPIDLSKPRRIQGKLSFQGDRFDHKMISLSLPRQRISWDLRLPYKLWFNRLLRSLCR